MIPQPWPPRSSEPMPSARSKVLCRMPDAGYRAIQRRVIASELTSGQAVQLIIDQAQAEDRALAAARTT